MAGPRSSSTSSRASLPLGLIGALLVGIVLALILALLLGGGTGGLVAASESPTSGSSQAAVASGGESPLATVLDSGAGTGAPTAGPTAGSTTGTTTNPTAAPTPRPTLPPTPRPTATPRPSATPTLKPKIDSFASVPNYVTNCDVNSTVKLSWTTTNADRVDIAVDPQGGNPLQHLYADHLALDGSIVLSYGCNPPNQDGTGAKYHEYVVIAYRGGSYVYHSISVFVQPPV